MRTTLAQLALFSLLTLNSCAPRTIYVTQTPAQAAQVPHAESIRSLHNDARFQTMLDNIPTVNTK
jgi:hypothetical protein